MAIFWRLLPRCSYERRQLQSCGHLEASAGVEDARDLLARGAVRLPELQAGVGREPPRALNDGVVVERAGVLEESGHVPAAHHSSTLLGNGAAGQAHLAIVGLRREGPVGLLLDLGAEDRAEVDEHDHLPDGKVRDLGMLDSRTSGSGGLRSWWDGVAPEALAAPACLRSLLAQPTAYRPTPAPQHLKKSRGGPLRHRPRRESALRRLQQRGDYPVASE